MLSTRHGMLLWGKLFLFASRLEEIGEEEERNMRKAMCPYRMQLLQQFRENKLLTTLNQSLFFLSFFSSFFLFKGNGQTVSQEKSRSKGCIRTNECLVKGLLKRKISTQKDYGTPEGVI